MLRPLLAVAATTAGAMTATAAAAATTTAAADASTTVRPLIFIHVAKSGGTSIEETLGITSIYSNLTNGTAACGGVPFMEKRFPKHASAVS